MPSAIAASVGHRGRAGHDAGRVVGVGFGAEANRRLVDLRLAVEYGISRVPRPTSTTSSPVANGSSVPVCPTRRAPSARRTIGDDVVRRHARRLVDEQQPAGVRSPTSPSPRRSASAARSGCASLICASRSSMRAACATLSSARNMISGARRSRSARPTRARRWPATLARPSNVARARRRCPSRSRTPWRAAGRA